MHRPVIRQNPKGTGAPVTWAEFVEAGLLRQYRRELKVPPLDGGREPGAVRHQQGVDHCPVAKNSRRARLREISNS